jgi:hypothetical protein
MPKFAIMNENIVSNLVLAETSEIASETHAGLPAIRLNNNDNISIGFIYNPITKTFTNPFLETSNA